MRHPGIFRRNIVYLIRHVFSIASSLCSSGSCAIPTVRVSERSSALQNALSLFQGPLSISSVSMSAPCPVLIDFYIAIRNRRQTPIFFNSNSNRVTSRSTALPSCSANISCAAFFIYQFCIIYHQFFTKASFLRSNTIWPPSLHEEESASLAGIQSFYFVQPGGSLSKPIFILKEIIFSLNFLLIPQGSENLCYKYIKQHLVSNTVFQIIYVFHLFPTDDVCTRKFTGFVQNAVFYFSFSHFLPPARARFDVFFIPSTFLSRRLFRSITGWGSSFDPLFLLEWFCSQEELRDETPQKTAIIFQGEVYSKYQTRTIFMTHQSLTILLQVYITPALSPDFIRYLFNLRGWNGQRAAMDTPDQ